MNWKWIAGFYEGEGGAYFINGNSLRIDINQSYRPVLKMILDFMGSGHIYRKPMRGRKMHYQFTQSGYSAAKIIEKLLPLLHHKEKIQQMKRALNGWEKRKNKRKIKT